MPGLFVQDRATIGIAPVLVSRHIGAELREGFLQTTGGQESTLP
jgi:hypothetical protein